MLAKAVYYFVRKLDRKRDLWTYCGERRFEPASSDEITISLPDGNGTGRCEFLRRHWKGD
jgi:hypothetical protein